MICGVMAKRGGPSIHVLSGERLRQAVIAGANRVISNKEVLDRINVFPVPDLDTGTNLAATMRAVIRGLALPQASLSAVSDTLASSALAGARGNSGVIMAQFFQGLREGISGQVQMSIAHFVEATKRASVRAREALAAPQEGTILTVIKDFADHIANRAGRIRDFPPLLEEGLHAAHRSLAETTNRLAVLRKAGVVDAGALGFVNFLEGMVDYFKRGKAVDVDAELEGEVEKRGLRLAQEYLPQRIDFRFCIEGVVVSSRIDQSRLKQHLTQFGDSVVVAGTDQEAHIHVHSNVPAYVLECLAQAGEIRSQRVEDILAQVEDPPSEPQRNGIALVTDSVCDLPQSFLTPERIYVVPVRVAFGEEEYLDRVEITPNQFYNKLATSKTHPKTSQPSPAEFLRLYRYLARHYAGILSIHLSAEVSGTYQTALDAAQTISEETGVPIEVVDCRTASAAQGLAVWATTRAIEANLPLENCRTVAQEAAASARVFVFVPTVKYFVRGGRLSPVQGKIAEWLHLKPILTVTEGKVTPAGRVIGRHRAVRRTLAFATDLAQGMTKPSFIIAHTTAPKLAEHYGKLLQGAFPTASMMITDAAPALGSHAGPGGAGIAVLDFGPIERTIEAMRGKRED